MCVIQNLLFKYILENFIIIDLTLYFKEELVKKQQF